MKLSIQLSIILIITSLNSGCSGKPFTLQSYADDYFNDTNATGSEDSAALTEEELGANPTLKHGHGARIAGSSTYNKDKERDQKGAMQKSLDSWLENEWEPTFEDDVNQTKLDKEAEDRFTIQHYIDKVDKYMDKKEAEKEGQPYEPAHYEKMKELPVIGK